MYVSLVDTDTKMVIENVHLPCYYVNMKPMYLSYTSTTVTMAWSKCYALPTFFRIKQAH